MALEESFELIVGKPNPKPATTTDIAQKINIFGIADAGQSQQSTSHHRCSPKAFSVGTRLMLRVLVYQIDVENLDSNSRPRTGILEQG